MTILNQSTHWLRIIIKANAKLQSKHTNGAALVSIILVFLLKPRKHSLINTALTWDDGARCRVARRWIAAAAALALAAAAGPRSWTTWSSPSPIPPPPPPPPRATPLGARRA